MQGKALQECVEVVESIAMLSNTKTRDGVDYQAGLLDQSLAFVDEKLSTSAHASELLAVMRNPNAFESIAGIKGRSFFKKHPWLEFIAYRLRMGLSICSGLNRVKTEILSDYSLDLDRFLLLASSFASAPNQDKDGQEIVSSACPPSARRRAEAMGRVGANCLVGGYGATIMAPRYDGISFGRNNSRWEAWADLEG